MALVAMAIPILPEKLQQWHEFAKELAGTRKAEFNESRKRLGVHERTFHQHTPMGDFVIVTLEGANPGDAFAKFAQDSSPFAVWMRGKIQELHGMDVTQPMPPMPTLIVDSDS